MKIKFYLLLIILTLSNHLYASVTVTESEKSAINYLSTCNQTRSMSYTENPGEIDCYKTPTVQINDFLSDKNKVNTKKHASDATKEAIIELTISEKITHYRSAANYMLTDRLKEKNLLSLDPNDPCYGHFQALSLIDQISVQLVTFVFTDHFDIDAAIAGIDAGMLNEIGRLSRITATMFKDSFLRAYKNHQPGIVKHIVLLQTTDVTIHLDPNGAVKSRTASDTIDSVISSLAPDDTEEENEEEKNQQVLTVIRQTENTSLTTDNAVVFSEITTKEQVTAALRDTKQKKDAYKNTHKIRKTKDADTNLHQELILLDNYRDALEAFTPSSSNSYVQINTAKKAYEEFINTKSKAANITSSNAGNGRPELKKRRSFYEMLTSTGK